MEYRKVMEEVQLLRTEMAQFWTQLASVKQGASDKVCDIDPTINLLEKSYLDFTNKVFSFIGVLVAKAEKTEERLGQLEQYSRRNCLLIHGMEEKAGENLLPTVVTMFKEKLQVEVKEHHIDRLHRIGPKRTTAEVTKKGHRPIIVKFVSYVQRREVFINKRKLKGSKLVISESLTNERMILLKAAKEKFDKEHVWTNDGKIVVLIREKKHFITCQRELDSVVAKCATEPNKEPPQTRNRVKNKN